ncbi:hypothetical protein FSARC_14132 [Fusarium sarcochroum]|uniref:Uncharacterized protein n=1 Tax=Fusarium sarcochroum TaxID=1208366 RepID=A0A8H4SVM8_9HYPO|nr:hypothetical protein FSARC_14132 [Fusarium sarcochroum]
MWVVQEVVLSREDPIFLHGDYHYAWESLGWAVAWLRRFAYPRTPQLPEQLRNIDTISNIRRARTRWPLDALISITQVKFHATDQRDKIYGVLGVALECEDTSSLPEELKPDYSIDVTTVYQRVARFLLKRNRSLAILNHARCIDGTETRQQRLHDLNFPLGALTGATSPHTMEVRFGFPKQYAVSDDLEVSFHDPEAGLEDISILRLGDFRVNEVAHVHRFDINPSGRGQTSDEFDATMAAILKLALSLMPLNDTLTWMRHYIQTTTARQHDLNGKDMDQSFADGVAWLYGFFFGRRGDVASLLIKQGGEIEEATIGGVQEHMRLSCTTIVSTDPLS